MTLDPDEVERLRRAITDATHGDGSPLSEAHIAAALAQALGIQRSILEDYGMTPLTIVQALRRTEDEAFAQAQNHFADEQNHATQGSGDA